MPLAESSFNELKQLAKKAGLSTKERYDVLSVLTYTQPHSILIAAVLERLYQARSTGHHLSTPQWVSTPAVASQKPNTAMPSPNHPTVSTATQHPLDELAGFCGAALESLEDLSVKQLQAKSKRAGISTIGKKSALVNRLHIYYQDSLANQDVQISNNIAKEPFCSDSLNRETISTVCNIQPLTPSIPSSEVVPDTIAPSSLVLNDPPNVHSVLPGVSVADVTTEMFYCIPCGSNISAQHLGGLAVIHRMRVHVCLRNTGALVPLLMTIPSGESIPSQYSEAVSLCIDCVSRNNVLLHSEKKLNIYSGLNATPLMPRKAFKAFGKEAEKSLGGLVQPAHRDNKVCGLPLSSRRRLPAATPVIPTLAGRIHGLPLCQIRPPEFLVIQPSKVSDRSRVIHPPITKTSRRTKFAAIRAPIGTSSVKYNTSENRKGTI
ncbi:hypothetical protein BSLG_007660 [Batrachochytrium salamandrivorans]|nr:hypothetical protein BSLG_007660 [Batrachochytrium salamandrivorans]